MDKRRIKFVRKVMICLTLLVVICFSVQLALVISFNSVAHIVTESDKDSEVYADIHPRGSSTSRWIKEDSGLYGEVYDVDIHNNSGNLVSSWTLTISIIDDCYVNQFWNGDVEIHQYVASDHENVQKLNLANYSMEDLKLDHIMEGVDLLIPLKKGDFIVYFPKAEYREKPVPERNQTSVGGVFYHKSDLDLTNYGMKYYFYRSFFEGVGFYILIVLVISWIFVFAMNFVAKYVYRKTERENQLRNSGIASLSDLYELVYIVDLVENTITPVGMDEKYDRTRPRNLTAQEQFQNLFSFDPKEEYRELARKFVNLEDISERLEGRSSIAFEYESLRFGWSRLQFIAMDRIEGEPLRKVLFTTQQINEEKKELNQVLKQVENVKMESNAKSAFLANMSHEIRTPINTILGLDTMILRESEQSVVRGYARDIKTAGNMLLALINSILDFSKLEAGKMSLIEAEYSLKQMIYEIESVVKTRIQSKNLAFKIDVGENLPNKLYGDDVRLKQIVINLLTNALKYTETGWIRLGVYGKESAEGKIHLLISVRDTGAGITPENQKKLFDRFSRFDEKKNRAVEGTGIGMNLVKGLLTLMDSELKVASVYGKGSEFYFEIEQKIIDSTPIGQVDWDNNDRDEEDNYRASFIAPNAHILVVDDNEMNLMVFENLLKENQLHIDKAHSGAMSLDLAQKNKYDVIFMDHMMPEMDGIETFKHLREDKDGLNAQTPVIILTANALQGAKEDYLKIGFNDFLSKPIDEDKLEEIMLKYLPKELVKNGNTVGNKKSKTKDMKALVGINCADVTYALEHTGSVDGVLRVMKQFVQVAQTDVEELRGYAAALRNDENDKDALNSYRIKVHAMKTSAALCGALQVYGSAAQLEYAAKNGAVKQVVDTTEYFVEFWNQVYEGFKHYFDGIEPKEKKEGNISREALNSLLDQLVTSMNAYDIKSSDAIIEELEKYRDDVELQNKMDGLKNAVANLDAEKCEEICKKLKGD